MTEDISRKEKFAFRFIGLSETSLTKLQTMLKALSLTVRIRNDGFVVSFDITEKTDLEPLYRFLSENSIDSSKYSTWISVVTSSDHSGVSLPRYVLDLIRQTKGGVDFSFVACLGDSSLLSSIRNLE